MTIDIDKLRKLLNAATPRPWIADLDVFDGDVGIVACVTDPKIDMLVKIETGLLTCDDDAQRAENWRQAKSGQELRDAQLIAAAVNALPALLAVYEAACAWENAASEARDRDTATALRHAIHVAQKP